jgi:NADP-reducing hydrogenase subunit HndC
MGFFRRSEPQQMRELPLATPRAPAPGCERLLLCIGANCARRQSRAVWKELERVLARYGLKDRVRVRYMFCLHHCELGPNMEVHPCGTWYAGLRPHDVEVIVRDHIAGGRVVEHLARDPAAEPQWRDDWDE